MAEMVTEHLVEHCPCCGGQHGYTFLIRHLADTEAPPIFGGPFSTEIGLVCPTTGNAFVESVPDMPGFEIIGPVDASFSAGVDVSEGNELLMEEYKEFFKSSRQTASEYCKTMLTTSTGAIPVYFAIRKYLGSESISASELAILDIIPPLFFLLAVVAFSIAQKPKLAAIKMTQFQDFRNRRFARLDNYISAGTLFFILGTVMTIVLFMLTLHKVHFSLS